MRRIAISIGVLAAAGCMHRPTANPNVIVATFTNGPNNLDPRIGTDDTSQKLHDLIYDFSPAEAREVFEGWFDHAASDPADGYTGADYAEHIRTEFSTFRWLLEPMLTATGFEIVTAEFAGRLYGAYTCIRRDA